MGRIHFASRQPGGARNPIRKGGIISRRAKPDVLAIGLQGRRGRTLRAIRKLRAREPGTNVLALADSEQNESLEGIIESGATGCIGKNRTAGDLVIAVDLVAAGRVCLPRQASRLVQRRIVTNGSGAEARLARMNEKERRIVALTARGFTSKEIGHRVFMTPKSVDNARGRVRRKLALKTRAELVAFADKAGLLEERHDGLGWIRHLQAGNVGVERVSTRATRRSGISHPN